MLAPEDNPHFKKMLKLFEGYRYKFDMYTVFEDFLYMCSASISNATDFVHYNEREAEYMRRVKKYSRDEANGMAEIMAELVLALEIQPCDYLGALFMKLEINNKWKGQFFTPYNVSYLMSKLTFPSTKEALMKKINDSGGFITINDGAVGGGALIIAAHHLMLELDVNPQEYLRAVSQDIDKRSVLMTFIQTSLLGIDNTVILGDTLELECREVWRTPGRFLRLLKYTMVRKDLDVHEEVTSEILNEVESISIQTKESGQMALSF